MAGKTTSLITGSNAKIKINGVTLAYAVDVQYDISVATIPVEVMGKYEVLANEPIATSVAGSFTVVRYTKAAFDGQISGAAKDGNGVGNWKGTDEPNGIKTHFNPGDILTSKTVDIELFRKSQNDPTSAVGAELFKKIRDARITRMGGSVNKRGILMETFQFVAELLEDDSFAATPSGEQDLSD
jgi:hypothetical protein